MPNRLLREGIVDSERINSLSAEAERMFYRLLVVADDLGRMDARPALLRARCVPLMETLSASKVDAWLAELASKQLLLRYEVQTRPYLAIGRWDQRVRSKGRYPPPPDDDWLAYDRRLSDICPTSDGLGKGKGKGKGAASEQVALAAEPSVELIPMNTGQEFAVSQSQCAEWGRLFPAVDVPQELRKMRAWCLANPQRRKTPAGIVRFATSWLSKAQDRGGPVNGAALDDPMMGAQ